MDNAQLKKCFSDDTVFNLINKMFITLQDSEIKRNNVYLELVVKTLIERMKSMNSLFEKAYKEIIFCGSFYKGTKVGHPNEFDLNIILKLPIICDSINFSQVEPAFIQILVKENSFASNYNNLSNKEQRLLRTFMYNGFLNPDKFRQWVEGIISKVISELPRVGDKHCLEVKNVSANFTTRIKVKKSGPAFTLMLNIPQENDEIHIDLVPALAFNIHLLNGYFKKLTELHGYQNKTCYAIPLPLKDINSDATHWRLSFCNQEKELLSKYGRIKPIIRQMKKLRDMQNWKSIASYFIETLFLNTLNKSEMDLDKIPSTLLFYMMLKELHQACEQHKIPFFWDDRYNLLGKIQHIEMFNISSRMNNIIKMIEKNIMTNKFILAEYILTKHEMELLIAKQSLIHMSLPAYSSSNKGDEPQENGSICSIL
nr:uncharacterized protein LOC117609317 isoform X1 [Osmia lignaria]